MVTEGTVIVEVLIGYYSNFKLVLSAIISMNLPVMDT